METLIDEEFENYTNDDSDWYGQIRTCPICGESYYCMNASEWAYKIYIPNKNPNRNGTYKTVCSWTCLRKYEKASNVKRPKRSKWG